MVGIPHEIKGSSIYCFVTAKTGVETNDNLRKELIELSTSLTADTSWYTTHSFRIVSE